MLTPLDLEAGVKGQGMTSFRFFSHFKVLGPLIREVQVIYSAVSISK